MGTDGVVPGPRRAPPAVGWPWRIQIARPGPLGPARQCGQVRCRLPGPSRHHRRRGRPAGSRFTIADGGPGRGASRSRPAVRAVRPWQRAGGSGRRQRTGPVRVARAVPGHGRSWCSSQQPPGLAQPSAITLPGGAGRRGLGAPFGSSHSGLLAGHRCIRAAM